MQQNQMKATDLTSQMFLWSSGKTPASPVKAGFVHLPSAVSHKELWLPQRQDLELQAAQEDHEAVFTF